MSIPDDTIEYLKYGFISIESIMDRFDSKLFVNFDGEEEDWNIDWSCEDEDIEIKIRGLLLTDLKYYADLPISDQVEYYILCHIATQNSMSNGDGNPMTNICFDLVDVNNTESSPSKVAEFYEISSLDQVESILTQHWTRYVDHAITVIKQQNRNIDNKLHYMRDRIIEFKYTQSDWESYRTMDKLKEQQNG